MTISPEVNRWTNGGQQLNWDVMMCFQQYTERRTHVERSINTYVFSFFLDISRFGEYLNVFWYVDF